MNNSGRVLWIRVWGIAALQGAITLSWVVYNLYLPIFLVQLGLSQQVAIALLVGENALEALIEPVLGRFSDRQQQFLGSRISIITIGIVLSSALFLAIPSLVIFDSDKTFSKWIFPLLAVAWASAMAIFRSPAMAMLGRCANPNRLPEAAIILTLVGSVVGALRFDAYGLILQMGAGFAFALGSFSLIAAGVILRWLNPPEAPRVIEHGSQLFIRARLGLLFITGMFVGWGIKFLIPTIKQTLALQISPESIKMAMTIFFLVLGLSAIPAGKIGAKLGNSLGMILGCLTLILALIFLILMPSSSIEYVAISLVILGFSLVSNGAVPYALNLATTAHSGFGVGLYFGGLNAGISLFGLIFERLGTTNISSGTIGAVISFGLVLICLMIGNKFLSKNLDVIAG